MLACFFSTCGYNYYHVDAVAVKRAYFGSFEFHPIHLDNVQCTGSEENITQCSYITSTAINCDHSEDAGVICGGECIFYYKSQIYVVMESVFPYSYLY